MEQVQQTETLDPRIRRTRIMLADALGRLLASKSLEQISVSDIAEAATLNRATFYDHYADKFALLEDMVAARFEALLQSRGVVFDSRCSTALYRLALAACDFLSEIPGAACTEHRQMERYLESAMVSVVQRMIEAGLEEHAQRHDVPPAVLAAVLSGAIYGGAKQWIRTPDRIPSDLGAMRIMMLLAPMIDETIR